MKTAMEWARQLEKETGLIGEEGEVAIVADLFQQAIAAAIAGGVQQGEVLGALRLLHTEAESALKAKGVDVYGLEAFKVSRAVLAKLTPPNVSEAPKPEGE